MLEASTHKSGRQIMATFGIPWTQNKYRPRHLDDIAGNKEPLISFRKWLSSWEKGIPKKKAVLLYGPAGTGKTVTAEAASRDLNFDLVEMNASDKRTTASIGRIVGAAVGQSSLLGKKRMILLDEVDGIDSRADRGAVEAIVSAIKNTKWPIVLTANDPWNPRLAPLRNTCLMIQFKKLGLRDSIPYLKKICEKESLEIDDRALKFIVERNEGDMRSIINDLQTLSTGKKKISYDDVTWLGWRDRKSNIFEVLGNVFKAKTCNWARKAVELSEVDYEMLFEWIYENAPTQLSDPRDRVKALQALAKADLFLKRIRQTQNWRLLSYALDFMTAGVAMSREYTKSGWVKMRFPERIKLRAQARRERSLRTSIGRKIAAKNHLSTSRSIQYFIPYIKQIFNNKPRDAKLIIDWLELDEEMIEYLKR
ncbi:replication factor C large subunit [Candidatus Bathyarchaeota archaeon]|nr:replication factor C large subunit [Candidatus Bathyarchaeota archaeon]